MKIKKLFAMLLIAFCCFTFAGCFGGGDPVLYVETTDTIYKFYEEKLLDQQALMLKEVDNIGMREDEYLRLSIPRIVLEANAREELAIMAAIECYNLTESPKELYIDYQEDDIIHVKLVNRVYVCRVHTDDGIYNYEFKIAKENGAFKITYKKEINNVSKNCIAEVIFNQQTGNLYIRLDTYSDNGDMLTTYKDFYFLNKSHTALRINTAKTVNNEKSTYSFNMFKEVVAFNIKIAATTEVVDKLTENELSLDVFKQTNATEKCGYLFSYDSKNNKTAIYTPFGNLDTWQ